MFDTGTFTSIQNNAGLPAWNALMQPAEIISKSLPYIFGVAGIILLINIVTAGFKIMGSQGDPKAMQEAQLKLKNSALGLLILFSSFWIVRLIGQFIGIGVFYSLFN